MFFILCAFKHTFQYLELLISRGIFKITYETVLLVYTGIYIHEKFIVLVRKGRERFHCYRHNVNWFSGYNSIDEFFECIILVLVSQSRIFFKVPSSMSSFVSSKPFVERLPHFLFFVLLYFYAKTSLDQTKIQLQNYKS